MLDISFSLPDNGLNLGIWDHQVCDSNQEARDASSYRCGNSFKLST